MLGFHFSSNQDYSKQLMQVPIFKYYKFPADVFWLETPKFDYDLFASMNSIFAEYPKQKAVLKTGPQI